MTDPKDREKFRELLEWLMPAELIRAALYGSRAADLLLMETVRRRGEILREDAKKYREEKEAKKRDD